MLSKSPAFTDEQWAACVEMVKTLMTSPRTSYEDFQAIGPAAGVSRALNLETTERSATCMVFPDRTSTRWSSKGQFVRRAFGAKARCAAAGCSTSPASGVSSMRTWSQGMITEAKRGVSAAEDQRPVPRAERGGVLGDRDRVSKTTALPPNQYLSHGALSTNGDVKNRKEVSAEAAV